eukprot:Sspe_Gene.71392::Locus_42326_Transcript_1_1_Confidence_1.000_Length_724::g.71392::m.71392
MAETPPPLAISMEGKCDRTPLLSQRTESEIRDSFSKPRETRDRIGCMDTAICSCLFIVGLLIPSTWMFIYYSYPGYRRSCNEPGLAEWWWWSGALGLVSLACIIIQCCLQFQTGCFQLLLALVFLGLLWFCSGIDLFFFSSATHEDCGPLLRYGIMMFICLIVGLVFTCCAICTGFAIQFRFLYE